MKVKVLNAPVKKAKEEKQWKCPKCLITFPDHVGLRQHILEFHKIAKLSLTQVKTKLLVLVVHSILLECVGIKN